MPYRPEKTPFMRKLHIKTYNLPKCLHQKKNPIQLMMNLGFKSKIYFLFCSVLLYHTKSPFTCTVIQSGNHQMPINVQKPLTVFAKCHLQFPEQTSMSFRFMINRTNVLVQPVCWTSSPDYIYICILKAFEGYRNRRHFLLGLRSSQFLH